MCVRVGSTSASHNCGCKHRKLITRSVVCVWGRSRQPAPPRLPQRAATTPHTTYGCSKLLTLASVPNYQQTRQLKLKACSPQNRACPTQPSPKLYPNNGIRSAYLPRYTCVGAGPGSPVPPSRPSRAQRSPSGSGIGQHHSWGQPGQQQQHAHGGFRPSYTQAVDMKPIL